jgi:biotin synthase
MTRATTTVPSKRAAVGPRYESPEYVRLSTAAAMTLGLKPGRFFRNARLHCLNLLLTYEEGCIGRCAYCGLSGERSCAEADKNFIRVDWPTHAMDDVVSNLRPPPPEIERVCISMVTQKRAIEDVKTIARRIRGVSDVGGPHRWGRYWESLEAAVRAFGRHRVGVHLIVGLGETERDMVETIQRAHDIGVLTHLFSFYPEKGSALEGRTQPEIGQYRRVQLARFLIDARLADARQMSFDESGKIAGFGLDGTSLDEVITSGLPFRTSGCPGKTVASVLASKVEVGACNRPYANSPPGAGIRNFPFGPNEEDIAQIKAELSAMLCSSVNADVGDRSAAC